uniref:A kinase (PRKA) anchor protein 9 n=1 Tax=Hippocampus comes TaxID=109280 RepID=A0A3Q2Y5Q6_HIPCM
MEEKDRAIALLNEQITKLQHLEKTSGNKGIDERDALISDLESQVECLRSEQERLKRKSEEEQEQLNAVVDKLQQELLHMERKEDVESRARNEYDYDEMKQKMDLVSGEFHSLKAEHGELLETHRRLKTSTENSEDFTETPRQRTAHLAVAQAQAQALEKNGASGVDELRLRVRELEDLAGEKDAELCSSRKYAEELQWKVCTLEEHLREKVAAALVSQATLDALQQQASKDHEEMLVLRRELTKTQEEAALAKEELNSCKEKLEKLQELLQVLRKQEMIKTELQEVQKNLDATIEEVKSYKSNNEKLQEDIQLREGSILKLKEELQEVLKNRNDTKEIDSYKSLNEKLQEDAQVHKTSISRLEEKLQEVQKNMNTTKEELNNCKSDNERLQEEIQGREVTISELKEMLQEVHRNVDSANEEASSYKSNNEKLQEDIKACEVSVLNLKQELQEVQKNLDSTKEELNSYKSHNEKLKEDVQVREKVVQMQELHAAEILDMEARHISESDALRRDAHDLEDECKALKAIVDKLRATEVNFNFQPPHTPKTLFFGLFVVLLKSFFFFFFWVMRHCCFSMQSLLREVHQEGMQVLSLSELPVSENEPGGHLNLQAWLKERDALLATVESLKGLIAHMQTTQVFFFFFLIRTKRDRMKDYSTQLKKKKNILENGSPLTQCDADGAPRADRLLLEELKGELSQTKLELETTLISQHKHLKELEALRAEVSQKASEVDALNEQLLEESRKGRELQWGMEKERCRAGRNEENAREQLEDLNLALEEQKSQAERLTSTLEQERQVSSRLCQQVEREKLSLHSRLQELQVQLETERAKAREMSSALGTERELRVGGGPASQEENLLEGLQKELDDKQAQVVDLLSQMEAEKLEVLRKDEELSLAGLKTRQNDEALLEARAQLERLEVRLSETQDLLASEEARRRSLEEDKERLEERLAREGGAGRGTAPMPHHQHHPGPWRTADAVLGKLHLVASKIRGMASKAAAEITSEELSLIQSSVDDLISMLQQTPALPSIPERSALSAGSSSSGSSLTERLLRQNAELTGFVGRLTEEKNDLRNHSLRLEEELRYYRHAGDAVSRQHGRRGASRPDSADALLLSQQKETWSREKVRLEKALHQALAQVARLRGEIRTDTLRELTGPEADNRMYGRYLRSESFRKSLIYQKKYLLLLLGSFQECEEATLAMLYRMGGRPSEGLGSGQRGLRLRGLMRFRSAVRVSIALSRMRFLVKRWHKTTGMSNTTQKSETTALPWLGRVPRRELKQGTQRTGIPQVAHLPCTAQVGQDSGASTKTERQFFMIRFLGFRFLAAGDPGALTCSHLQNYDPDRALTDYISRLEALQRRLGSLPFLTRTVLSTWTKKKYGVRQTGLRLVSPPLE